MSLQLSGFYHMDRKVFRQEMVLILGLEGRMELSIWRGMERALETWS
jgi:hypothetical protein